MKVCFKIFHSESGWEKICEQAAAFSTGITPDRLISISHSQGPGTTCLVTVWYWDRDQTPS
jgi:hypothetical protein